MKKENKKSHSWKSCTIIKPAEEEGVLLSFFFLHRIVQREPGRSLVSTSDMCLSGRVYSSRPEARPLQGEHRKLQLVAATKSVCVCLRVRVSVQHWAKSELVLWLTRIPSSLSRLSLALWTFSVLMVLVEIGMEKKTGFQNVKSRCVMEAMLCITLRHFSRNSWRGMYLKKECNAVFRLLTS